MKKLMILIASLGPGALLTGCGANPPMILLKLKKINCMRLKLIMLLQQLMFIFTNNNAGYGVFNAEDVLSSKFIKDLEPKVFKGVELNED